MAERISDGRINGAEAGRVAAPRSSSDRRAIRGRLTVSAFALALLGAGAVSTLLSSTPSAPDGETASLLQQATPTAGPGGIVPGAVLSCSIVGLLDQVAIENGELWGRLQNTGAADAAPGAVELGWAGSARLRQVVSKDATGRERVLFEGDVASPAFVSLADAPAIAPGATAELGLRFELPVDGLPWTPGPIVIHMKQGCRVVLAPIAKESPCGLEVLEGPRPADQRREVIEVTFRGTGQSLDPRTLRALRASWPVEANGALLALEVNGRNRITLDEPLTKSPATLPLDRLLGRGLHFLDGERLTLGLVFAKPVAEAPYVITIASETCSTSATTWLGAPSCGLTARDMSFENGLALVRVSNSQAFPIGLRSVSLFWPVALNGPLVEVTADGKAIWSGEETRSPATVSLRESVVLAAQGGAELRLRFGGAPPDASSGGSGGIGRAAYTVVVESSGGCRVAFSGRETVTGCNVSAGQPVAVPERNGLRLDLSNAGGDARLREVALAWNAQNGALTGITLDGTSLFKGSKPHSTVAFTLPLAADMRPLLPRNARQELWLSFERPPAVDGYLMQLSFDGADKLPCQDLLISRPLAPRPVEECPYELNDVRLQDIDVLASLRSRDATRGGELVGLRVEWPTEQRLEPLRQVVLIDEAGVETVLWAGSRAASPLDVGVRSTILLPTSNYTLRLRFAGLIEGVNDPGETFSIRLELADGCQIVDRRAEDAPPKREVIEGVLQAPLPTPLLSCCLLVLRSDNSGAAVRIEADQRTRIEPDAVTPHPGDLVSIDALRFGPDRYVAERIRFIRFRPTERLVGRIDKIAEDPNPTTGLPAWISVIGRRTYIVERTVVDGRLSVGAVASVVGERNPDGSLTAHTINVAGRNAAREFVEIEGIVQKAIAAEDVQVPDLRQLWSVGRYDVRVMVGTLVTGGSIVPGEDPEPPRPGTGVRVYGATVPAADSSGGRITIDAEEIEIFTPTRPRSLAGRIESLPAGSLIGAWTVRSAAGESVTFQVSSLAVVDSRLAPTEVGLWARVRLESDGADGWIALDVETDWEE